MNSFYNPQYRLRPSWGHVVSLIETDQTKLQGTTIDPDEEEEIMQWCCANAYGRRIGFDQWQFPSEATAKEFIVMFKLRWS